MLVDMNAAQTRAFAAFLATLDAAQRATLLDALGSHQENMETAETEDDRPAGLDFVSELVDALGAAIVVASA